MTGKPQPLKDRPLADYEAEILSRVPSEHFHDIRRILDRAVRRENGCLEWIGAHNGKGYGNMKSRRLGSNAYVHRLMLEAVDGPLLPGEFGCHECDNPPCVEPSHLFAGTSADNAADAKSKGRASPPPEIDWPSRMRTKRHHWQKLDREDIPEIRKRLAIGDRVCDVARSYGVADSTIGNIKAGTRWAHVS